MIIEEIIIENYLCYYGTKRFELTNGLNIILGANGEGKTKFFEALEWLFKGENVNLPLLVSAKRLAEVAVNEMFQVKVTIRVNQHNNRKILSRSFDVLKTSENNCNTSNFSLKGIEENVSGERTIIDGSRLLDQIFPTGIRKYSMFKGESALDIFDNKDTLIDLINLFSDAKYYEKYAEKGRFLKIEAEKAVSAASKKDTQKRSEYTKLESDIKLLDDRRFRTITFLNSAKDEARKINANLQEVGNHIHNAEALEIVNKRINEVEERISNTLNKIDENYTTLLFDEKWILLNFKPFHKEFVDKINLISKQRRELQSDFDRNIGIKEGKKRAKAELLKNATPLPIGVPSKAHMKEMLQEEICKVCNRPAEEGSDAYNFMMSRLKAYLKSQEPIEPVSEDAPSILFTNDYISRLTILTTTHEDSLSHVVSIGSNISDLFEFNAARKIEVEDLEEKKQREIKEREVIIGNSTGGASKLSDVLKNYNSWQEDLKQANRHIVEYERELNEIDDDLKRKKKEKDNIDIKTASTFLNLTKNILTDVEAVFVQTKERKFDEFIELLQNESNQFYSKINNGSFTGSIVINKKDGNSIEIELQEDGRTWYKPNQSTLTSMHISILFAISKLTTERREEPFPMIFDAPTSSFGEPKTAEFINIINETNNQIILLSKDFIVKDKKSKNLEIKQEFSQIKRERAFWIKLERPFDEKNLKTLNTEVITL